jgi:hypothetical protein
MFTAVIFVLIGLLCIGKAFYLFMTEMNSQNQVSLSEAFTGSSTYRKYLYGLISFKSKKAYIKYSFYSFLIIGIMLVSYGFITYVFNITGVVIHLIISVLIIFSGCAVSYVKFTLLR